MNKKILNIFPAPANLCAVYRYGDKDEIEPVAALALIEEGKDILVVGLVIGGGGSELEIADDLPNFDRLEWQDGCSERLLVRDKNNTWP